VQIIRVRRSALSRLQKIKIGLLFKIAHHAEVNTPMAIFKQVDEYERD